MIRIRRLPPGDQRRILDQISQLADGDFGGRVQRPFVTALYTGRRPPGSRRAQGADPRGRQNPDATEGMASKE